jgi:hypothetical protein
MRMRQLVALGLSVTLASTAMPTLVFAGQQGGQQSVTIGGTAKNEAKKPFTDYTVRARNTVNGAIAGQTPLDQNANFSLGGLPPAIYAMELLNHDGKVVCTEGPFNMTRDVLKDDVKIACNKVPVAWLLLGAAAAAGITAAVVSGPSSPSQ